MTRLIFLLPPSEGKHPDGRLSEEMLSFPHRKPLEIAASATEKDLKCSGHRYEAAKFLNTHIAQSTTLPAIERYDGVMFRALNYMHLSEAWKQFFDDHFCIVSGLYGILKPQDWIANYKLPASTKWLYAFWGMDMLETLIAEVPTHIINLLSGDYEKFFSFSKHHSRLAEHGIKVIHIHFLQENGKKVAHGVKSIKWTYIREICEGWTNAFLAQDFVKISEYEWELRRITPSRPE